MGHDLWFALRRIRLRPFYSLVVALTLGLGIGASLAVFAVNFYVLLSWLQPALIGGRWITDPAVLPPWVAALTHLIFGWMLAVLYPLGQFTPYRQPSTSD